MPSETRKFLAELARRSPRARLYSRVPRSSAWPSTVTVKFGYCFRKPAQRSTVRRASGFRSDLSKSKNTRSPTSEVRISCGLRARVVDELAPVEAPVPVELADWSDAVSHAASRATAANTLSNLKRISNSSFFYSSARGLAAFGLPCLNGGRNCFGGTTHQCRPAKIGADYMPETSCNQGGPRRIG